MRAREPSDLQHETWVDGLGSGGSAPASVGHLGRYQLLAGIGSGGMGEVYRAYDPELDRGIALKRLSVGVGDDDAVARLAREAQTIARLNHPHVVQVFDVGRDSATGDLFIAMELIDGPTVREWLRTSRSRPAVLGIFGQAGAGLLAAHQRGIVHRDFKPENVLVSDAGLAKVVDFGLAKPTTEPSPARPQPASGAQVHADTDVNELGETLTAPPATASSSRGNAWPAAVHRSGTPMSSELTPVGARLGTPAYMPPEQAVGRGSDRRADQFSFAVALYEALAGHLPFRGKNPTEYALAVADGQALPFASRLAVPRGLRQAIFRALSPRPEDRFSDLTPLLNEIRRADGSRSKLARRGLVAVALVVVLAAGLIAYARARQTPSRACQTTAAAIDAVWTPEKRHEVGRVLSQTPRVYAADTAERVVTALDVITQNWRVARLAACERSAHPADASESAQAEVEGACLDRNLAHQRHLATTLVSPSPTIVERASAATEELAQDLQRCSEPAWLVRSALEPPAHDPEAKRARLLLDRARVSLDLGIVSDGLALLEQAAGHDAIEHWPADMVLDWSVLRASVARISGDHGAAKAFLELGAQATVGRRATLAAARWHFAYAGALAELDELDASDRSFARAHLLFSQNAGPDALDTIVAAAARGHVLFARGRYSEALARYSAAAESAATRVPSDDSRRVLLDEWVAGGLERVGRTDEAIAEFASVVARRERLLGTRHPQTLDAIELQAACELRAGRALDALAHLDQVLELREPEHDTEDSIDRAALLANRGAALSQLDHLDEATATFEAARDSLVRAGLGPDHTKVLAIEANLAAVLNKREQFAEAAAILQRVLSRMRRLNVVATTNGMMVRLNLAVALAGIHQPQAAIDLLNDALGDASEAQATVLAGRIYLRLARIEREIGQTGQADAAYARAEIALADEPSGAPWSHELRDYRTDGAMEEPLRPEVAAR